MCFVLDRVDVFYKSVGILKVELKSPSKINFIIMDRCCHIIQMEKFKKIPRQSVRWGFLGDDYDHKLILDKFSFSLSLWYIHIAALLFHHAVITLSNFSMVGYVAS